MTSFTRLVQLLLALPPLFAILLLVLLLKQSSDNNRALAFRTCSRSKYSNSASPFLVIQFDNKRRIIDGDFRPAALQQFSAFSRAAAATSNNSRTSNKKPNIFTHKNMMVGQKDAGGEKVKVSLKHDDEDDDVILVSDDATSTSSNKGATPPTIALGNTRTLAGDYWIECSSISKVEEEEEEDNKTSSCLYTWTLVPLKRIALDLDPAFQKSAGATAWAALHSFDYYSNKKINDNHTVATTTTAATTRQTDAAAISLQSRVVSNDHDTFLIHLTVVEEKKNKLAADDDDENKSDTDDTEPLLIAVLARVLAQWTLSLEEAKSSTVAAAERGQRTITIHWPDDDTTITTLPAADKMNNEKERIQLLYKGVYDDITRPLSEDEVVEMVDRHGLVLGRVPRQLVHQFNLLHRGIGMFVTRDRPIVVPKTFHEHDTYSNKQQPDLYVHQRTATKRIFPSLYDMFVGGVALAGESSQLTAYREVAEELGLEQAFLEADNNENHNHHKNRLSDCIWTCAVCTAYNRCVVDFFTYTMDTTTERISWQDEEVAWGDFVPYHTVEAAADLSIQRLAKGNLWPGRLPPTQSHYYPTEAQEVFEGSASTATTTTATPLDNEEWKTWDFVPDGLLVWEAWLQFLNKSKE